MHVMGICSYMQETYVHMHLLCLIYSYSCTQQKQPHPVRAANHAAKLGLFMPCMFLGNQLKYAVTSAARVECKVAILQMPFPQLRHKPACCGN